MHKCLCFYLFSFRSIICIERRVYRADGSKSKTDMILHVQSIKHISVGQMVDNSENFNKSAHNDKIFSECGIKWKRSKLIEREKNI